jgi:hypothetical protein
VENGIKGFSKYGHSSASFYEFGVFGKFEVTHYKDLYKE